MQARGVATLLVLLTLRLDLTTAWLCLPGWTGWITKAPNDPPCETQGHCYIVITQPKTWNDAKSHCENMAGATNPRLVDIHCQTENMFVYDLWKSTSATTAYIGLHWSTGITWTYHQYHGIVSSSIQYGIVMTLEECFARCLNTSGCLSIDYAEYAGDYCWMNDKNIANAGDLFITAYNYDYYEWTSGPPGPAWVSGDDVTYTNGAGGLPIEGQHVYQDSPAGTWLLDDGTSLRAFVCKADCNMNRTHTTQPRCPK